MSKRTRRHFTIEQKAALLRRHLEDKVPVSDLCNEAKIQPSMFYDWQRQLFERMGTALVATKQAPNREKELEARIAQLEAKLTRKDAVIAEISEEHVKLKKELGEP
jgi:transposase-like protein